MLTQTLLIKITLYEEGVPLMIVGIAPASPSENSHDSVSLFDITRWRMEDCGGRTVVCGVEALLERVLASN